MADRPTRLSIVMVTYNSRVHVHACLESLTTQPVSVSHDIVVVDNASADDTVSSIRARWPNIRVIESSGNSGFAKANNRGIRETSSELILLLNPDTVVTPGAIDALIGALDARPDAAIAGPRLVDATGWAELSCGTMLSPLAELRQKLLVKVNERRGSRVAAHVQRLMHQARDVGWVSGACLLVRRADAEAVKLLDERYFMYVEDVDFCASVRARGRKVIFVPSSEVVHHRGQSRATAPVATTEAYRRSQVAFYEKHHARWAPFLRLYLKARRRLPDSPIKD